MRAAWCAVVGLGFKHLQSVPVDLLCEVESEDKRSLGLAQRRSLQGNHLLGAGDGDPPGDAGATVHLALPLTPRQVDHLQELRAVNRKGDVVLNCKLEVRYIESKTVLSHLKLAPGDEQGGLRAVYQEQASRHSFWSQTTNMWILSGDNGRAFLSWQTYQRVWTHTISASDWIHDCLGPWQERYYMVLEVPRPNVSSAITDIGERLEAACQAAGRASASLASGEWDDVIADLRPVWELFRFDHVRPLLQRSGYTEEAADALLESINQQFTFASKFVHRTDLERRTMPAMHACKEEALLAHSFAMTFLNLISRKAARHGGE